ncbi:MAG: nucleoside triphosphate pyrophosphohydrolase [Clostridia bacterium]|nr:nucleoside triphosphate pyrophosphohydrolase [Clostridia bacterium]
MKIYNKLVRDRIPEIIKNNGQACVTEILSTEEYITALDEKLREEMEEYQCDKSIDELADLLEVVYSVAKARGWSIDELEEVRKTKAEKRGGFEKRIFLKEVQ